MADTCPIYDGVLCSACGLAPRKSQEGGSVPLKRCSRCKQAWYHDLACQKRHFAKHKKDCGKVVLKHAGSSSMPKIAANAISFKVEARKGRGNCLVASAPISRGERISPPTTIGWQPLVIPALLETERSNRCALCFQKLIARAVVRYDENRPQPQYPLLFCSVHCRDQGRHVSLDKEEVAIGRLYEQTGPPRIFSTAILLYRIYYSTSGSRQTGPLKPLALMEEICKLQCKIPETISGGPDSSSHHHTQAVVATVAALVQVSKDVGVSAPAKKEEMEDMVNRIKINGFSISDGESMAMGIGLYSTSSFMNHSCQPNAVQTFLYGQETPPSLYVTACVDIEIDQEIQISYTDNSCPRHLRRQRLLNDYFFWCDCWACNNAALDSQITGFRCSQCGINGNDQRAMVVEAMSPSPRTYRCHKCNGAEFSEHLQITRSLEDNDVSDLEKRYKEVKQLCFPDSWYVQESGDQLLHTKLDELGRAQSIQDQEKHATQALLLLNEVLSSSTSVEVSTSGSLRRAIQNFKAAKLRLFLDPNPQRAIELLERAMSSISPFFERNHELVRAIEASLHDARM